MTRNLLLWFSLFIVGNLASAADFSDERFASGLLRSFSTQRPRDDAASQALAGAAGERRAATRFINREYGESQRSGFTWRGLSSLRDATHTHWIFELTYAGRRIADHFLKIHTRHDGGVQYASSSWSSLYSLAIPGAAEEGQDRARARRFLAEEFRARHGNVPVLIRLEPVVWVDDRGNRPAAAYEVTMTSEYVGVYRKFFIDERSLETLEEKRAWRGAEVYKINPARETATTTVTLMSSPATTLRDSRFIVRREQGTTSPELRDVDPAQSFTPVNNDTATYDHTCTGSGPTSCPNQAFDAVNVFYHLQQYRTVVDAYYAQIGAPTDVFVSTAGKSDRDPLQVMVNLLSYDFDGDGATNDERNNAGFIPVPCRADGSIDKCLVFLRPAVVTADACGTGNIVFNNLAREALVIAHEYQHYVTDTVTKMVAGGSRLFNVGDALHEGYSDYFAASHVSQLSGSDVTSIGEYGFDKCPVLIRNVAIPQVYKSDQPKKEPYDLGLTWASGLWVLRTELGRSIADRIAYKSQFFMPTRPGFIDAVEALVKADEALFEGTHRSRIRELFYNDLKFIGGQAGVYRDAANGIAEVGFRSCASVTGGDREEANAMSHFSGVLLALWLGVTVLLSRLCTRRFE